MSRGLGVIEKSIIECLSNAPGKWCSARYVVSQVARSRNDGHFPQDGPTPALAAAVRRALASLARKGIVQRAQSSAELLLYDDRCQIVWALSKPHNKKQRRDKSKKRRRSKFDEALAGTGPARWHRRENRRLAQILGMMGSSHDGEVLAAVRSAEQERQRLDKTWLELLGVE